MSNLRHRQLCLAWSHLTLRAILYCHVHVSNFRLALAAVNRISAGLNSNKDFHARWRAKVAMLTGESNVNVQVKFTGRDEMVNALIDSGTDISCFNSACVPWLNEANAVGIVLLGGF